MKKKFFIIPPLLFLIALLIFLTFNRATVSKFLSRNNSDKLTYNISNPSIEPSFFSEEQTKAKDVSSTVRICPHCNATNSPKSEQCIRCGRSLKRPK